MSDSNPGSPHEKSSYLKTHLCERSEAIQIDVSNKELN